MKTSIKGVSFETALKQVLARMKGDDLDTKLLDQDSAKQTGDMHVSCIIEAYIRYTICQNKTVLRQNRTKARNSYFSDIGHVAFLNRLGISNFSYIVSSTPTFPPDEVANSETLPPYAHILPTNDMHGLPVPFPSADVLRDK